MGFIGEKGTKREIELILEGVSTKEDQMTELEIGDLTTMWDETAVVRVGTWEALQNWKYQINTTTGIIYVYQYIGPNVNAMAYDKYYNEDGTVLNTVIPQLTIDSSMKSTLKTFTVGDFVEYQTTSFSGTFKGCTALRSVDMGKKFAAANKVIMSSMFEGCTNLTKVTGMDNVNAANVTGIQYMFAECSSLKTLSLRNWDLSKANNIASVFQNCTSLTDLDISGWTMRTSEGIASSASKTAAGYVFDGCSSLTTVDLSGWNDVGIGNAIAMFRGCSSLQSITGINNLGMTLLEDSTDMFNGCNSLSGTIDISGWNLSNCANFLRMFKDCSSLNNVLLFTMGENTAHAASTAYEQMFYGCNNLGPVLDVSNLYFNTPFEPSQFFYAPENAVCTEIIASTSKIAFPAQTTFSENMIVLGDQFNGVTYVD